MIRKTALVAVFCGLLVVNPLPAQKTPTPETGGRGEAAGAASLSRATPGAAAATSLGAADLGVAFVEESTTTVVLERAGRRYLVDLVSRTVREVGSPAPGQTKLTEAAGSSSSARPQAPQTSRKPKAYKAGDDVLFTLPTGRRLERHGLYVNFTHRFPFESAFKGRARGGTLLGLDDFSIAAFGFRFGVTDRLSVLAYRAPGSIGRPIELMVAYRIWDESKGAPVNGEVRFSVDGQNNFSRNFTTNFELIISRSLRRRAQVYLVPTLSLHNRPVIGSLGAMENPPPFQPCDLPQANGLFGRFGNVHPCANTFALGVGLSVDIRPTVALLAEVHPTLANGAELGIHRPAFAFGIQKKIRRHAFTFGFTNSPGTTIAQRIGTRATYLVQPGSDTPSRMFVGFNLTRQLR